MSLIGDALDRLLAPIIDKVKSAFAPFGRAFNLVGQFWDKLTTIGSRTREIFDLVESETSKRTLPSVLSLYLFLLLSITLRILSSKSEKLGRQCSTSLRALRENSKQPEIRLRRRRKQSRTSKTLGSKRSWKSSRSSSKA